MRRKQHSRSQVASLLVGATCLFLVTSTGCGSADDLQAMLDSTSVLLNQANADRDKAQADKVKTQMDLDKANARISDLEKTAMGALCAPMQPFDSGKVFSCVKPQKVTQIGTWKIRDDLTRDRNECTMGLVVDGQGVMSCKALDLTRAVEFLCNDWVCRDKAAPPTPM